jgi:hypothetical protein
VREVTPVLSDPFARAHSTYRDLGWTGTLWLPLGQKWPPPDGFTGEEGGWPLKEHVDAWAKTPGNLGLRLPQNVVVFDIDIYKPEAANTMATLEAQLGKLPRTWRNSARAKGGHLFFCIPFGRQHVMPGQLGEGVEILRHNHRYSVAWPSINPDTSTEYRWYDPTDTLVESGVIPAPASFPQLPQAWLDFLSPVDETGTVTGARGSKLGKDGKVKEGRTGGAWGGVRLWTEEEALKQVVQQLSAVRDTPWSGENKTRGPAAAESFEGALNDACFHLGHFLKDHPDDEFGVWTRSEAAELIRRAIQQGHGVKANWEDEKKIEHGFDDGSGNGSWRVKLVSQEDKFSGAGTWAEGLEVAGTSAPTAVPSVTGTPVAIVAADGTRYEVQYEVAPVVDEIEAWLAAGAPDGWAAGAPVESVLIEMAPTWATNPTEYLWSRLVRSADLRQGDDPIESLVLGWLTMDSLCWLAGAPKTMKSFVALDMACHIALGRAWWGMRVKQGTVLYVFAEGQGGARRRLRAWEKTHNNDEPVEDIIMLPVAVQANDAIQWDALVEVAQRLNPVLIVIDTQARVTTGLEENSAKEMGIFVTGLGELREATGACVMTVHHHNKTGGVRGSSAISGALDTLLETERESQSVRLTSSLQKDGEQGQEMTFDGKVVELGESPFGEPITSLALIYNEKKMLQGTSKKDDEGVILDTMRKIVALVVAEGPQCKTDLRARVGGDRKIVDEACRRLAPVITGNLVGGPPPLMRIEPGRGSTKLYALNHAGDSRFEGMTRHQLLGLEPETPEK